MSKIYGYVKEKNASFDSVIRAYYINIKKCGITNGKYRFDTLFNDINERIEYYKEKFKSDENGYCFLIVNNTYEDIVNFIALLEVGIKPVIVNELNLRDYYLNNHLLIDSNTLLNSDITTIMPFSSSKNGSYEVESIKIKLNSNISNEMSYFESYEYNADKSMVQRIMNAYLQNNPQVWEKLNNDEYDFALPTSGTTGGSTVITIKELDLYKKIRKYYDLHDPQTIFGFTPISSISGLIFSLYLPIMGDGNCIFEGDKKSLLEYHYARDMVFLLPGNYLSSDLILSDTDTTIIDRRFFWNEFPFDEVKCIIFLGDKVQYDSIKKLKDKIPARYHIPIYIYYGRTENLGIISKIEFKDIVPVYVYYQDLAKNKIIYSFDKKNVFEKSIINGKTYCKKSNIPYDDGLFTEVLPIALCDDKRFDVKVKDGIFNEIIAEGKETGDFGFALDNRFYLLCRKEEFIISDNKYSYVSSVEKVIRRMMNKNIETLKNEEHMVNHKCYCVINDNNHINIYIPCQIDYYLDNNYRHYFHLYKNFKKYIPNNIIVDNVYLINQSYIPRGSEIGKLQRKKLLNFLTNAKYNLLNDNQEVDFKSDVEKELGITNLEYVNNEFVFSKFNYSSKQIIDIVKKMKVLDFREDDENYYIVFSDEFLFTEPVGKKVFESEKRNNYYAKYDGHIPLKEYILGESHVLAKKYFICQMFTNENKDIFATISEYSYLFRRNQDCISSFEFDLEISKYYRNICGCVFDGLIFSIDEENHLCINNQCVNTSIYPKTFLEQVEQILVKAKELNKEKILKKN